MSVASVQEFSLERERMYRTKKVSLRLTIRLAQNSVVMSPRACKFKKKGNGTKKKKERTHNYLLSDQLVKRNSTGTTRNFKKRSLLRHAELNSAWRSILPFDNFDFSRRKLSSKKSRTADPSGGYNQNVRGCHTVSTNLK